MDIEFPPSEEELVLYAFISPEESYIKTTTTKSIYDTTQIGLPLLDLEISPNTALFEAYNDNFYWSSSPLQVQEPYALSTSFRGKDILSEVVSIPPAVVIDSTFFRLTDQGIALIDIYFQDDENHDFYAAELEYYQDGQRIFSSSDDSLFLFDTYFSDEEFENQTKILKFRQDTFNIILDENYNTIVVNYDSFVVNVYTLSEEYYLFDESRKKHAQSIAGLEGETENLWSNINNAYGFLCTFNKTSIGLKVE